MANAGLGEIYARSGKVPEANAAYAAAAKTNPSQAAVYLRNEAVIFFHMNNSDAQVAAADEAIKIDPNQPVLYYLKGQGLISKATVDPKTHKIVLPPGCGEAYEKYGCRERPSRFCASESGRLRRCDPLQSIP